MNFAALWHALIRWPTASSTYCKARGWKCTSTRSARSARSENDQNPSSLSSWWKNERLCDAAGRVFSQESEARWHDKMALDDRCIEEAHRDHHAFMPPPILPPTSPPFAAAALHHNMPYGHGGDKSPAPPSVSSALMITDVCL